MFKSRLAPTPSGFLHIGNAYNFLLTFLVVNKHKGALHLRIDDHDTLRTKQAFIDDLFHNLEWLGIHWESGPQYAADAYMHSQQNRFEVYGHYIDLLKEKGCLFACACSRKTVADGVHYPGTCIHQNFPLENNCNWRLLPTTTPETFYDQFAKKQVCVSEHNCITHPIIKRKDGLPAYQLVSLIDDVEFGINCIVRGEDLLASTALQLFLSEQLNLPSFRNSVFYHHPLMLDASGNKLSKSAGSVSLADYKKHHEVGELYRSFASWIGIGNTDDVLTIGDLQESFNKLNY